MLLAGALQLGQGVLADVAHEVNSINANRSLEEVREGDDRKFVVLERMPEAIVERGSEGLVAALFFVGVLDPLFPTADGFHELCNAVPTAQTRFDRLTDEHT